MNWHEAWGISPQEYETLQQQARLAAEINQAAREREAERVRRRLEKQLARMQAAGA
jgi:hypothetical protein